MVQYCDQAMVITTLTDPSSPYLTQLRETGFRGGTLIFHDESVLLFQMGQPSGMKVLAFIWVMPVRVPGNFTLDF